MSSPLDARLEALARAADLAGGRLEDADVAAARAVVERAGARLGLGVDTTVVALAGPTGAGKSSLFNALAGAELARVAVRRPTTSAVAAAVRGEVDPALLEWLGAGTRHVLDGANGTGTGADGFVLLDLPDYDSIRETHRLEAERVIELVDLLVWVVDPQKYADSALHDRYLRSLAGHREAMLVVLNQADRLDPAGVDACRADLGRLLAEDGLKGLPVLAVSARDGSGLGELEKVLRDRAAARAAATARLAADVEVAAGRLAAGAGCGRERAGKIARGDRERLLAALAQAAGVPTVTRAVARSHRRRGSLATGWPVARWLGRLRPDPLKRLGIGRGDAPDPDAHTSLPPATPAQRSQVDSAVRSLAAGVAGELPQPWPGLVRGAASAHEGELPARLDRVMAGADLERRRPRWWTPAGWLQRLLALVALAGALWLLGLAALGWLQLSDAVPLPEVEGIPLPTLLLAGGALGGLVLALLARWLVGIGAARRARAAERALRRGIETVADELIVGPVTEELGAREELCRAVAAAAGRRKV